jgi:hypothetical protein
MTDPFPDRLPEQEPETIPPPNSGQMLPLDDLNDYIPPPPPPLSGTVMASEAIYDDPPRRGCAGCGWGVAGALGCLALLILPIIVLLLMGTITINGLLGGVQNVLKVPLPAAAVMSSQTIVTGIQPLGQLVSVSAQLAKADIFVGVQQGALNACGFSANHVAQGAVEAGIDLTKISEANIQFDASTDTYTITLPPAELTSCRIDFIRQYDRTLTACAVDWDEARLLANYQALTEFRNDAIEGGVLSRAQNEARIALGNFVTALTGQKVNIIFQAAETTPDAPASCQPEIPAGWTFDSTQNAWVKGQ